ncbi:hypothetical protein [Mycobacterium sp. E2497]|uniref:hypothetical protein n=1 Tax=Mycobacterium sp. E2497 TaxID=1834135 RepID=UPI0009EE34EA|nr:hypothetical protein [Mycobacterium sp. E2497]
MNFEDIFVSSDDRYAIGVEKASGRYYISMPVSNGIVDYEEYYELTPDQYRHFLDGRGAAIEFIDACRRRERDHLLLQPPGSNRGTPV